MKENMMISWAKKGLEIIREGSDKSMQQSQKQFNITPRHPKLKNQYNRISISILIEIQINVMQDMCHFMHRRWRWQRGVVVCAPGGGAHVEAAYVATKIA